MRSAILASLLLASAARAQFVETFEGGQNRAAWVLWDPVYDAVVPTGGNPGEALRLDNVTTGPHSCHYVEIVPTAWPPEYAGDYRARGITTVGLDVETVQGRFGGAVFVRLVSDPGTPADVLDDTTITFRHPVPAPSISGWFAYDFDLPTSSTTIPPGWMAFGPHAANPDVAWNHAVQDVDSILFIVNADPSLLCVLSRWIFLVDNLRAGNVHSSEFCAGDGVDPDVTVSCPCANFGASGHGCSNSASFNGALLESPGWTNPESVVLVATEMPATSSCIYLQGDGVAQSVFGDGVRCADGNLIRLRTRTNVAGASRFPDATDTLSLSQRGGVAPGSGATRLYQVYYRNAAATFCPPATFNVTNGRRVTW